MMNQTALDYSIRQLANAFDTPEENSFLKEACTADFPKLYTDKLTAPWMVGEGIIDEWPYGPLYMCCKFDADVVVDLPPEFDQESCRFCQGKVTKEFIPGVGELEIIKPCKQHRTMPCNSAHNLKLSVILGLSLLAFIT